MLLQDIFSVKRIKVDLEGEDKDEVFEEMVDIIVRGYGLDARDEIIAAIQEREAKMSTGIKTGIALPHGKTDAVTDLCGAIGISRNGIDYDSLDGEPVFLVIMLVSSKTNSELHLRTLKRIAGLLELSDFYDRIKKADTPETAYAVLKSFEDIIHHQDD
jgi:PTS system fructose-specific IIC component/PTS system nitrogen regulatory IIA component